MKRVALLIASERGGNRIPGVYKDIENLNSFLCSNIGGAWDNSEITHLFDPTKQELDLAISNIQTGDYAFVSYSGHGFHSKTIEQTKICIRDNSNNTIDVPILDIIPNCRRHTIFVDCCRHIEDDSILESTASRAAMESFAIVRPRREKYRALFDALVCEADIGGIILYSCDLNESAAEDSNGGCFTYGMIKSALEKEHYSYHKNDFISVDIALELSSNYLKRLKKQQNPQLNAGRRRKYFPFSVFPAL